MICDLSIVVWHGKRMTMNFGSPYDRVWVGNNQILLFCPFLFTVDFKALCPPMAPTKINVCLQSFNNTVISSVIYIQTTRILIYFIIYINIDFLKPSFRRCFPRSKYVRYLVQLLAAKKIAMVENWAAILN